jgi:hypothetical protein
MKKNLFGPLLLFVFIAISCKKDSGGTSTPEKFMSLTAGSTWNYKLTNNPSTTPVTSNYTLTASNNDSTANGRTYRIFTNSAGPNEYYNITGDDYYTFRTLPAALNVAPVELIYLKGNAGVNDIWFKDVPVTVDIGLPFPVTITIKLTQKIAQKGITRVVNGITYNNVIDVQTDLSASGIPVAYTLTSNIHYYYAPKVGQIESYTKIDFTTTGFPPVNFEEKRELQSSTIL